MSVESLNKIARDFEAGLDEACAAGNGKAYLFEALRKIAEDVATSFYLQLDTLAEDLSPDLDVQEAMEALNNAVCDRGLKLIDNVADACRAFNFPALDSKEAMETTAIAFRERLEFLFAHSDAGGAA